MDFFLRNFQILVGLWMIVDCVKAQILLNKSFGPFVYQGRPIWQYRLWSFQTRGTKLERFLPKNHHTQRKLLNLESWISGGLRSFQKSEF
jgi:hypothetical protein